MDTRAGAARASVHLAAASAVNGVGAFIFAALATRHYGADASAPLAQLWSIWLVTAAVLTFPVQHWVIRCSTGLGLGPTLRRGTLLMVLGAVALYVPTLVLGEEIFGTTASTYPLVTTGLAAGGVVTGVARGILVARGATNRAAALIAGENVVRVVAGAAVILLGWSAEAYAVAMLTGTLLAFAVPTIYRRSDEHVESFGRTVGPHGLANGISQVVLTAGPLLVQALGAPDAEVTAMFATLAVARAPYLLMLGLGLQVTYAVVNQRVHAGAFALRIVTFGILVAAAAWAVGWAAGPAAISLLFGDDAHLDRASTALIAVTGILASVALIQGLLAVAAGKGRALLSIWVMATAIGVSIIVSIGAQPALRVAYGVAGTQTAAIAGLYWLTAVATAPDRS